MPLLFAYGTLQEGGVQLSLFGRRLRGRADELPGFEPSRVPIEDPVAVAASGRTHYPNVKLNGRTGSRVPGLVFEVTEAELAAADRYEESAAYRRIEVTLVSGKQAWVYLVD